VRYPVNLDLFAESRRSPSVFELAASMNAAPGTLRDFSVPMNSYFPTGEVLGNLQARLESALKVYPGSNRQVAGRLADFVGLDATTMVIGSGATELITWICRLLVGESLAMPIPTAGRWLNEPRRAGKTVHTFLRRAEREFQISPGELVSGVLEKGARAAVLTNPNNPTGALMSRADVLSVLDALRDLDVVVIDESFIDFAAEGIVPSVESDVSRFPNALVIKSLGQSLGLPGLHLGYAVGNPSLVSKLRDALPTGNVTGLALALIEELPGARQGYQEGRRRAVQDRVYLEQELRNIPGLGVFPSRANFVYARLPEGFDGVRLRNHLLGEHGCLLRACGDKEGSDSRCLRVASRPATEVDFLVQRWLQSASELGQTPGNPRARAQGGLAARLQAGRSVAPSTAAPAPPSPSMSASVSSSTLAAPSSLAAQSREAAALAVWDLTPIPEPTPTPTLATSEPFMALVEAGIISVEVTEEGIESSGPAPAPIPARPPAHPPSPAWANAQSASATGPDPDGMAGLGSFASFASFVPPPPDVFDGSPASPATVTMPVAPMGVRRRQTALLGALAILGAAVVGWFALHDRNGDARQGTLEIRRPPPEATIPITSPLPGSPHGATEPNGDLNGSMDPTDLANLPELPPLGGTLAGTGDTGLAGTGDSGGASARTGEGAAARRKSKHKGKRRLARQRHRGTHGDDDLADGRAE
jgi:histidinol-phosphate/aromatic aminotransferase/cobyric acid decarboxylase-like protein